MTMAVPRSSAVRRPRQFYIDGVWVEPLSSSTLDVVDSTTEEVFLTIPPAQVSEMDRAVTATGVAFDTGRRPRPWHAERGVWLDEAKTKMFETSPLAAQ